MSLDRQTAQKRAQLIRHGSIQYNFNIILQAQIYHGLAEIIFYHQTIPKEDLLLDFSGDSVEGIVVNQVEVEFDDEERDNFIILPRGCLQKGKNRVSVSYHSTYNNNFSGLITFSDAGEQFLYTDFQPYGANQVFPCFDQPNLKALINLTVIGPQKWRVLSNEHPYANESFTSQKYLKNTRWGHNKSLHFLHTFSKKVTDASNTKMTFFTGTRLLPSYIFCFCAGNYRQIPTNQGPVSMSLFCIPAAQQKLKTYSKFIFDVTIKCMKFYSDNFAVKFPFNKYDQIFIRQFGSFAMQNAGIVTFDQSRMLPDNPTTFDLYTSALVVSHELSHHWFGNYVTMAWWDDLWLNESFAQWMSCYSLEALKQDFNFQSYLYFRDGKNSGYQDDQRNNATHPIRGTVDNTDEAFSIFDGITYEKGASVLKQLTFLVGETKFFQAVQRYFDRFQWGNATIDDLLSQIGKDFPQQAGPIQEWKSSWLETASLNVFDINWDQQNNKITLNQSSFDDKNILRVHKLKIALFNQDGSFTNIPQDIFVSSASTDILYPGRYSAVLVNQQDWTFAENIIDPVSLQFFRKNINKIKDSLTRLMVWYNFRSMVKMSRITLAEYVALIKDKLFIQTQNFILQRILENLKFLLADHIEESLGNYYRSAIFNLVYQQLQRANDTQKEKIQILQESYISYARTQEEITALWKWLNKADPVLNKRQLTIDQKWQAVVKIFTLNIDDSLKWDIFYQVRASDHFASRIQDYTTIVNALIANQQQFQTTYEQFKNPDVSISVKYLKAIGWNDDYHYNWLINNQDKYFKDIVAVCQDLTYEEFQFFYTELRPIHGILQTQIDNYNQVISQLEKIQGMKEHIRNLRKFIDDLNLRIKNISLNTDTNLALSQARAINRSQYIQNSSVRYNFHVSFVREDPFYEGMTQISFKLNRLPSLLPLDFKFSTIQAINVNQKDISLVYDGQFVFFPQDSLKIGDNIITIRYKNKFNNDGDGCMSYTQTVGDQYQYIYTNFQPYSAHRFVPCFDQPDLKASAQFNIIVPEGWLGLGNERSNFEGKFTADDYKANIKSANQTMLDGYLKGKQGYFYQLYPTEKISTYLYCIAAGQYYLIKVPQSKLYRNIPMSIYCIQAYSSRLDRMADFIIQMTTKSLQLFQSKFGVPYQFSKYDTIFCREFKSGAMQNPGLITFRDQYLFPEDVSLEKMLGVAGTIIHENVHNWFGNYVTMKWWDDLWLNESFADFISYYALEKLKDQFKTIESYDSGWKLFLVRGVPGYREDQITETTHAVRSVVENTSVATTYFDRITYQKGSATLKQLMFLMGQDNFFRGVQDYFNEFGWKNATIDNFLNKMQKYFTITDFTLEQWKNSWLLTPSLNKGSVQWDCNDLSDSATLTIHQNYYTELYPTLRYHKTRIAFFKNDGTYDVQDILLNPTPTTTLTYKGSNNYQAILVNYDYWDYFKYTIDDVSLGFFQNSLNQINKNSNDVLTRMIVWHDINEQVRDAKYKVNNYIQTFRKFIFEQPDDKIFEFQFAFARDVLNSYLPIPLRAPLKSSIFQDIYTQLRAPLKQSIFQDIFTQLSASLPKNDQPNRIILLKDQLVIFAGSDADIKLLQEWREGVILKAFPITVTQAWQVVLLFYTLSEYLPAAKDQVYNDQFNTTPGIQGQLIKNSCEALIADDNKMEQFYQRFKQQDQSTVVKSTFAAGWNNLVHQDLLKDTYKTRYFGDLPLLSTSLISNHFQFFYQNLRPIDDDLTDTIANYEKIKLKGGSMIGHMKLITQIKYDYQLRQKLYAFNKP